MYHCSQNLEPIIIIVVLEKLNAAFISIMLCLINVRMFSLKFNNSRKGFKALRLSNNKLKFSKFLNLYFKWCLIGFCYRHTPNGFANVLRRQILMMLLLTALPTFLFCQTCGAHLLTARKQSDLAHSQARLYSVV